MNTNRYLVIDDHPLMRGAIRNHLEAFGFAEQVDQACTLAEGLRRLAGGPRIDLVVLDLALPDTEGTSGVDTLKVRYPSLKILATSGYSDAALIDRCLQAGATGFLPKTSAPDCLAIAVRTVLGGGIYLPAELEKSLSAQWLQRQTSLVGTSGDVRQLGLTDRQTDVLRLVLRGLPNKLIGRELDLAEGTVKVHVSGVLRALGVRNRTQAVLAANRLGLRLPDSVRVGQAHHD
jgi:DNA-binding NarL/FixJ family response regulator